MSQHQQVLDATPLHQRRPNPFFAALWGSAVKMVACITAARQLLPRGTRSHSPKAIRKLHFLPFKKRGGGEGDWELRHSNDSVWAVVTGRILPLENRGMGWFCAAFPSLHLAAFTAECWRTRGCWIAPCAKHWTLNSSLNSLGYLSLVIQAFNPALVTSEKSSLAFCSLPAVLEVVLTGSLQRTPWERLSCSWTQLNFLPVCDLSAQSQCECAGSGWNSLSRGWCG